MSFAVGYVEPIQYKECDPTALDSVLEALRSTSKGRLPYPEPLLANTSSDDVCDSKYIGDLDHITANLDFRDEVSFSDNYTSNVFIFAEEEEECKTELRFDFFSLNRKHPDKNDTLDSCDGSTLLQSLNWTSYRVPERSPNKSPPRCPQSDNYESPSEGEDDDVGGEMEQLLARLQIDVSLPAVVERVQRYHSAYVSRVAAIHAQTVAALHECRQHQGRAEDLWQEQHGETQRRLHQAVVTRTDQIMMSRTEAAEQRKAELLAQLQQQEVEEREAEAARATLDESTRQTEQDERQQLVSGLRESYKTFSAALDQLLLEIREGTVSLPSHTQEELNTTLQEGGAALSEDADPDVISSAAQRIERGITVLKRIRSIVDSHKTESSEAAAARSTPPPGTSSPSHHSSPTLSPTTTTTSVHLPPGTAAALSAAAATHRRLAEVYASVSSISASFTTLQSDARADLSRAVASVNTLSSDGGPSDRQKLRQLQQLLSGRDCEAGGVVVRVQDSRGPQAMFVRLQLASKLVALAHDRQASSQAVYASLMLRLWQVEPLLQHLFLHELYRTCPHLLHLPNRDEYGSEEEYLRALGYRYRDGKREGLDSYTRRMGSCARLYGRLTTMQVEPPPLPGQAWRLLSRLLVTPPQSAVTCAVLHGFLSAAGAALQRLYGQQLRKLLLLLAERVLPRLEETTEEGGEQDLSALRGLLQGYLAGRGIPPPPQGYRPLL